MSALIYYIICAILSVLVLVGIALMSKVEKANFGNGLSAFSLLTGVVITLIYYNIFDISIIYILIAVGSVIGYLFAKRVKMIQMPQLVALLNGVGGAASALVGSLTFLNIGSLPSAYPHFTSITAILAVVVGFITLIGSLVAAGKLHKLLPQQPIIWSNHRALTNIFILGCLVAIVCAYFTNKDMVLFIANPNFVLYLAILSSCLFGYAFAIRVGGADMPITISLLNSLSGVAGSIAGMAIGDILLVAVGGIVGASGLLLTQIMCRNMNRQLMDILLGKTSTAHKSTKNKKETAKVSSHSTPPTPKKKEESLGDILNSAKEVIIVPGYGMALAQAQHQVKQLADKLERQGARVRFAVHPVAGRMPGHMNVLLAEADVPYDELYEMDQINDDFKKTDLVVVIGANDVINPAAREAKDTPIYGMPVLNVDEAKEVIICNFDTKPGYAGVDNPLYESPKTKLILGDAKESLNTLLDEVGKETKKESSSQEDQLSQVLNSAKEVIIVPGYGMALAQAQHQVKQLADKLERQGARVRFAVHPVAGRMPGHMNVLLAEADVPYDELYEMDQINDDFKSTDLVVVIGANDVINPAAREAKDTPIYGMPVLNVDEAKEVIICNFDTKPGYAGVDNPLYESPKTKLILGDAKESLNILLDEVGKETKKESSSQEEQLSRVLNSAKEVIIVPGYGMALAQAQHQVKQLADKLERQGARVRFAVHPVAGRMPGHMNVLLAEADVPYDELYEMDQINDDFKNTDLVVVIGANDVINPAAREAKDTPIYGMPVLNVDEAKEVIICNFDTKPGYAGVDNPLYESPKTKLILGDAKESLNILLDEVGKETKKESSSQEEQLSQVLNSAKEVIIVPGYGMALAQAQHQVKQLADKLERQGARVRFAVHPVAGRMPGHMNVLLAEADVPYDELYEMDQINDDFKNTDLVVVIGANDVINPAAREAEDTPIYGMPVLNVDEAKEIIICNFDTKPGYAGVDNPLYENSKTILLLGDAKESLDKLLNEI